MKPLTALAIARALENKLGVNICLITGKTLYEWVFGEYAYSMFKTTDMDPKRVAHYALEYFQHNQDKKPKRRVVYDD